MLKDVSIIILDEATADVDTENEDRLQKAIEALARNKTITMIARRLEAVEANRTIKAAASSGISRTGPPFTEKEKRKEMRAS